MREIHVRFGLAPDDRRCLTYAADLAALLNGYLHAWLPPDEGVERLMEGAVPSAFDTEQRLVARRLGGIVAPEVRYVVRHGNISKEAVGTGGIAVGPRGGRLTDVVSVVPMNEEQPLRRGRGPICVPFGKGESAVRACEAALTLASKLKLDIVFYHTTWKDERLPEDAGPEAHMLPEALGILRALSRRAEAHRIRTETVIETAPTVVGGILAFALERGCSFIAMARGPEIGRGSHVDQALERSVIPLIVAADAGGRSAP